LLLAEELPSVKGADGVVRTEPIPEDALSPVAGSSSRLPLLGWLSAGSLLVFLVILRLRRRTIVS
jgi:hypothetical protein